MYPWTRQNEPSLPSSNSISAPSLLAIELPRFSTMGSQNEYKMAKISMLFSSCPKRLTLRHRHQVVSIMRILFIKRASRTKLCLISSSAPHRPFKDLNRVPPLTRHLHQDFHIFPRTIEHLRLHMAPVACHRLGPLIVITMRKTRLPYCPSNARHAMPQKGTRMDGQITESGGEIESWNRKNFWVGPKRDRFLQ